MNNEAIYIRESPTLEFIMREINEQKISSNAGENHSIGKLFYWLAAAQIGQIAGGAVLGFFVAPASLFVSRDETEAFSWIAAAAFGYGQILLGVILIPLALVAGAAFRREKNRRKFIGILTAGASFFAFPLGTILGGVLLRKIFKAGK